MEEADKDWVMIRIVGDECFFCSPGQRAVKPLLLLLLCTLPY